VPERAERSRAASKRRARIQRSGVPGEIIVADNGSTDGSQAVRRSSARAS